MTIPFPTYLKKGRVRGRQLDLTIDTAIDSDTDPDAIIPIGATITFTPTVSRLVFPTSPEHDTDWLRSVNAVVGADGHPATPNGDPLYLVANKGQPNNDQVWTWRVTIKDGANSVGPFDFDVTADADNFLTDVMPVQGVTAQSVVVRGLPGVGAPPAGTPDGYIATARSGATAWSPPGSPGGGGGTTSVSTASITDIGATGVSLVKAATPAAAQTAMGLGSAATRAATDFDAAGAAATAAGAKLDKASNLADIANPATARTNLGLGTAATSPATAFAAAAAAVPVGGTAGQALVKNSGTDRDVSWGTISGGGTAATADTLAGTGATGVSLMKASDPATAKTALALDQVDNASLWKLGGGTPAIVHSLNVGDSRNPLYVRYVGGEFDDMNRALTAGETPYHQAVLQGGATRNDPSSALAWAKTQSGSVGLVLPGAEDYEIGVPTADALNGQGMHLYGSSSGSANGYYLRGMRGGRLPILRAADNIAPPMHFIQTLTISAATGSFKLKAGAASSAAIPLAGITLTTIQNAAVAIPGASNTKVFGSGSSFTIFWDHNLPDATAFTLDTTGVTAGTVVTAGKATNEYHLIIHGTTGVLQMSDLIIDAGVQANDINTFRVRGGPGSYVKRVTFLGGYGSSNFPSREGSYETTVCHTYLSNGILIEDVDIDGRRTSALGWGNTNSMNVTGRRVRSRNNKASHAVTFFRCSNVVVEDFHGINSGTGTSGSQNGYGLNVEEPYGPHTFYDIIVRDNSAGAIRVLTSETVPATAPQGAPVPGGAVLPARRDISITNLRGSGSNIGMEIEGTANPYQLSGFVELIGNNVYSNKTGIEIRTPYDTVNQRKPNDVIAESYPRASGHPNSTVSLTSGVPILQALYLPRGYPIGNLRVYAGAAAPTTTTHCWMEILDEDGNLVAQSADNAAWNTSATNGGENQFAIAKLSTGAAAPGLKVTPSWSGLYFARLTWVGTGTAPTLVTSGIGAPLNSLTLEAPALCGTGTAGQAALPSAYPYVDTIQAALGTMLYVQARL